MHRSFDHPFEGYNSDIVIPEFSAAEMRAACIAADGGEGIIDVQDLRYAIRNRLGTVALAAHRLKVNAAKLEGERVDIERRLRWMSPTVSRATATAPIGRLNLALAGLFATGSLVCTASSIAILTEYVQASGTGLFHQSVLGALLFSALPSVGAALALKSFEVRLESARARWIFVSALTLVGMAGLACWLAGAALGLAPETGSAASALLEGGSGRAPAMTLVVFTVICDVAFGAAMLSGATYCLSTKQHADQVPNPAHVALIKERLRIEARVAQCDRERDNVEGFLIDAAAGRQLTRRLADQALNRAREQFTEGQALFRSLFIARFLSNKD